MDTITIFVNQTSHQVEASLCLDQLLPILQISSTQGIAIAVDDSVVPKSTWSQFQLQDQSKVLIINATQGG